MFVDLVSPLRKIDTYDAIREGFPTKTREIIINAGTVFKNTEDPLRVPPLLMIPEVINHREMRI